MISQKDFLRVNKAVRDAQNSDTPFLLMTEGGMAVAGDPNKIEKKYHDYKLRFRFPKVKFPKMEQFTEETDNFYFVDIDYTDISVDPDIDHQLVKAIIELIPLIKKMGEDGSVEEYTLEEEMELYSYVSDDAMKALKNFVSKFLKVDEAIIPYAQFLGENSITDAFVAFCYDFPEVINEADSFLSGNVQREFEGEEVTEEPEE